MDSEDIINDDKYYEKNSYNVFDTHSIYGLNIEGIKRYYSIPTNKRYHHMVKLKKDLDELFSKYLKQKEIKKKNYKSNIYDDERLYKMYAGKNEEDKNKIDNLFQKRKSGEKPLNIKIIDDNINKTKTINRKEIKQKILGANPALSLTSSNRFDIDKNNKKKMLLPKGRNIYNKNISYSLRKFRKKYEYDKKMMDLPFIRPRKIIIDYQLTNDAGVREDKKNIGHNFYMGSSYNPQNFFVDSKNRTKRNVFGGLFTH